MQIDLGVVYAVGRDVNLHLSLHPLMEGGRDDRSALIEAGVRAARSAWATIIAS